MAHVVGIDERARTLAAVAIYRAQRDCEHAGFIVDLDGTLELERPIRIAMAFLELLYQVGTLPSQRRIGYMLAYKFASGEPPERESGFVIDRKSTRLNSSHVSIS